MASNGVIQSGTPNHSQLTLTGARFEFRWEATPGYEPGITDIKWELWAVGRSTSPTRGYGYCLIDVAGVNGSTIVGSSDITATICEYQSGNTSSTYTFFTGKESLAEGNFQIKHASSGLGSFHVYLKKVEIGDSYAYLGYSLNEDVIITLDLNMPYKYVYIHNGTTFVKAIPYIDSGTEWKVAEAYIDTGTEWKSCN